MSTPRHDLYPHLPARGPGAVDAALDLLYSLAGRAGVDPADTSRAGELLASARAELEHLIPAGPLLAVAAGGDDRALRCPYCGGDLYVNLETFGGYMPDSRVESIECGNGIHCNAVWEPDGAPRDPAEWISWPDLYDPPTPPWDQPRTETT